MPANTNTGKVSRTINGGRWWIVYPLSAISVAVSGWLARAWPPSKEHELLALTPGICVLFVTAFLFGRASEDLELRTIGLSLLVISIGAMALHGLGLSMGLTIERDTDKIMAFACYGSAAGLLWLTIHWAVMGAKGLRSRSM